MIRDRGNIKWTSMMLPEHVAMLRELKTSQEKKEKPFLDEQRLEEMNEVVRLATEENKAVQLTYFSDYDYRSATGFIQRFDPATRALRLCNEGTSYVVPIEAIIEIHVE